MKVAEKIDIDRRYCKGCMLCKYVCKFDVFEPGQERSALDYLMPRAARIENCRVCGLCESHCPDLALTVVEKDSPLRTPRAQKRNKNSKLQTTNTKSGNG